jgi:hypothetical protein
MTVPTRRRDRAVLERPQWTDADTWLATAFLLGALLLYVGLWSDLGSGYLTHSASDQNLWEWFFAVAAKSVTDGGNPLFTHLQNQPLGVNLMANTSMLGLGIPLAPLTLLCGPTVTWAVVLTVGLAGTGFAWYRLFFRYLVTSRAAAALGGAFCAFAPPVVSHATAHPNFVVGFVFPLLLGTLIRLARGDRPVRDGVLAGLLTAYQVFLGEEPLLIFGLALLVFGLAYLPTTADRARVARTLARGLGIGALVTLAIVAIPLWWQFSGPQSYEVIDHGRTGNDLAAFTHYAGQSLAGDPETAGTYAMNPTEQNAFFGWPLVVLLVVLGFWLRRDRVARALGITVLAMAWLSTGVTLNVAHTDTDIYGPWALLTKLPPFDSVLESRLTLGAVPAIAALLAIAADRIRATTRNLESPARLLWIGALTAALLPLAPLPLETHERADTPTFFADDTWKSYVDGGTVVTVPLPSPGNTDPLHWQVDAGLDYAIPGGYFVGPNGPTDPRGRYGAPQRPTERLLDTVAQKGEPAGATAEERAAARQDLRYWRADVVVLVPRANDEALRETVDALLDTASREVNGVWLWDVRHLTP